MADVVLTARSLSKVFRTPLRRRRIEALRSISLEVRRGEVFGFIGPNGAGKTTTIRILMGLIRATGGEASILGHRIPSRAARARIGFLPEQPYFYDYLTVAELLDLVGRVHGLDRASRRRRADELIARVGLERARGQHMKKFSKGMLQRAGLAQALMNDPAVVVLDEPMSGLDPIGRKEVRDLILELRDRGTTVFFSSHVLSDVEQVADRVAIVARGELVRVGTPVELVDHTLRSVDVVVRLPGEGADALAAALGDGALGSRRREDELTVSLPAEADVDELLARARAGGARVVMVTPHHQTLEEVFLAQIADAEARAGGPRGAGAATVEERA
ncbi:MAG: ABC transporter ATP-binding protein [Kofleriaceae bacterium]